MTNLRSDIEALFETVDRMADPILDAIAADEQAPLSNTAIHDRAQDHAALAMGFALRLVQFQLGKAATEVEIDSIARSLVVELATLRRNMLGGRRGHDA